jgi:hypothetical protein
VNLEDAGSRKLFCEELCHDFSPFFAVDVVELVVAVDGVEEMIYEE